MGKTLYFFFADAAEGMEIEKVLPFPNSDFTEILP